MLIVHDFVLDPVTGFVMLHGEPLRNRSHHDLRDAAIFSGIDISDAKSALDIERIVTAYFMRRLHNGKQLEEPERRAHRWHQTVRILLESPVSSLEDSF